MNTHATRTTRRTGTKSPKLTLKVWMTMVLIAVLAAAGFQVVTFGLSFTQNPTAAVEAAEALGLTDVEVVETHRLLVTFQGCGRYDVTAATLRAVAADGSQVQAHACAGSNGWTVRPVS